MRNVKFFIFQGAKLATIGLALVAGSSVMAVQSWSVSVTGTGTGSGDLNALCTSNSSSVASGACGTGLAIGGWSTGTGAVGATTSSPTFNAATVYDWGTAGLGVVATNELSSGTGPHAADNKYGTDAFLFNFTTASNLSGVKIGWNGTDNPANANQLTGAACATGSTNCVTYNDSDLSVFAWTGAGAPTPGGTTQSTMINANSGWKLIGNYYDVGAVINPIANTISATSSIYSSYWLVSAYSSAYGGTDDGKVDAFKILAISATNCNGAAQCGSKVPEPGSLALFGAALMGFVATRRRKQQAS